MSSNFKSIKVTKKTRKNTVNQLLQNKCSVLPWKPFPLISVPISSRWLWTSFQQEPGRSEPTAALEPPSRSSSPGELQDLKLPLPARPNALSFPHDSAVSILPRRHTALTPCATETPPQRHVRCPSIIRTCQPHPAPKNMSGASWDTNL